MQRVNVYSHALPFSPPCLKCLRRSVFGLNIPRIQNCSLSLLTSEGGTLGPGWMRREGGSGRRWGRANHNQNTSYKSYFQFKKLDESRGFHRKWRHPDSKGSSETIIFNLSSRMVRNQIQFPRQRENFLNTHTHTHVHIHAWIYMHLHTHINNSDRFFFLSLFF